MFSPVVLQMASSLEHTPIATYPGWLIQELRSDHAGETGAVMIYRGILAVSRDPVVRQFALEHLETEQRHLALIEEILPPGQWSACLPIWKPAGFLTGAIPALFGRDWVFHSIQAVETFVDQHYQAQIDQLGENGEFSELRQLLITCQQDEIHHRDDAAQRVNSKPGLLRNLWTRLIGFGSAAAVSVARRF